MKAARYAKISGEMLHFDVPDKLKPAQELAFNALYALYCAEVTINRLTIQLQQLRAALQTKTAEETDYQQTITELDAMIEQLIHKENNGS